MTFDAPSPQALAAREMLRSRRDTPVTAVPTLAEQRLGAEHFGDTATEPERVSYENVDAGGVPAQWVTPAGADTSRVVLYLHGGGYVYCTMRSHSRLVGHLASAIGCRALNLDYRLAPEHPHPAAVTDAVATYRWLLAQGIAPEHIAVSGDSAGGGLAAALLLKARDEGLPMPAAAALMSPWVDLALTAESVTTRAELDVLMTADGNRHCADVFLAGQDPLDPYASPLYADLGGLPPMYVQVGDHELLRDDGVRLVDQARAAGVDVSLDVFPEMQHVHQSWAGNIPEADDAIQRIGAYVRPRLGL